MGTHGCVTSSNYLATEAGFEILTAGGNAVDVAVATGLALQVVEPHMNGIGGECPIIIYSAKHKKAFAISGQGTAPASATLDYFRKNKIRLIPGDGFLPATVPASFDAWITCLARFGTKTLQELIAPSIRLAAEGFPVYPRLQESIELNANRFLEEWPTTANIFLPNQKVPRVGQLLKQQELAKTYQQLVKVEKQSGKDRALALLKVRDFFYAGPIARRIVEFASKHSVKDATGSRHSGLISFSDLSRYETRVEETVTADYEGLTVHKCGSWSQGPVFLQQLQLLQDYDLRELGHNSADYIHVVTEAAKLAFADRERFYGDPLFSEIPLTRLLSRRHAQTQRRLINMRKASMKLRLEDGKAAGSEPKRNGADSGDTTHLDAVDSEGNMVSATPSGGWIGSSPIIKGLGFALGTRGQMFSLQPSHPNCIAPGKRPRTTLSPTLVTRKGRPFLAFGTPGGDQQDQWTLQFFLNFVIFGMNLQAAIDAPTFHTSHFPSSFFPRDAHPGSLHVEDRIPHEIRRELRRRGHEVVVEPGWSNGRVTAVHFDSESNLMSAAASSRYQTAYALGR